MKAIRWGILIAILVGIAATGCGGPQDPLPRIHKDMQRKGIDTYSIVLADMQTSGNFIKSYTHSYNVVTPERQFDYGPLTIPQKMYDHFKPYLGMTIWSQKDGKGDESMAPPGYAYVGDPRYGEWRRDSSGRSFWTFYGQYRLLSDLLGMGGRIFRNDYDTYRGYRSSKRPYYGPNQNYGTGGTLTRKQYPDFFQRQQSRSSVSKSTFANKVNQRIGRTRTSSRGRGFSGGK